MTQIKLTYSDFYPLSNNNATQSAQFLIWKKIVKTKKMVGSHRYVNPTNSELQLYPGLHDPVHV